MYPRYVEETIKKKVRKTILTLKMIRLFALKQIEIAFNLKCNYKEI